MTAPFCQFGSLNLVMLMENRKRTERVQMQSMKRVGCEVILSYRKKHGELAGLLPQASRGFQVFALHGLFGHLLYPLEIQLPLGCAEVH